VTPSNRNGHPINWFGQALKTIDNNALVRSKIALLVTGSA
jgi:hypothetical protein